MARDDYAVGLVRQHLHLFYRDCIDLVVAIQALEVLAISLNHINQIVGAVKGEERKGEERKRKERRGEERDPERESNVMELPIRGKQKESKESKESKAKARNIMPNQVRPRNAKAEPSVTHVDASKTTSVQTHL